MRNQPAVLSNLTDTILEARRLTKLDRVRRRGDHFDRDTLSAHLKEELLSIKKSHPGTEFTKTSITVPSPRVVLNGTDLGFFKIVLKPQEANSHSIEEQLYFINENPLPDYRGELYYSHPHIAYPFGEACLGEAREVLYNLFTLGEIGHFFDQAIEFLFHWNDDTAFQPLYLWTEEGCCLDCGAWEAEDYVCKECLEFICETCVTFCEICEGALCNSCLTEPPYPLEVCCSECLEKIERNSVPWNKPR